MKWKKQIPNEVGYWLRVNAGHRVQLHRVFKADKVMPDAGKLHIFWGWSGEQGEERLDDKELQRKLNCFYWYGPLPEPPDEAL